MLDDRFIRPRYNGHCFADLPATIKWVLTGQGSPSLDPALLTAVQGPCDTVVLFFIDAFGWRFLDRVGNLVVLPFAGESVWWYEKDKFEMKKHGAHGGLTPDEVEIPLLLFYF